jgi:glyoxylase-like metal-dependent hydrolase (beta-lactamase superfamily II)
MGLKMNYSIHNIGTVTRNNWIIKTKNGIIAVDTWPPGQAEGFFKRCTKYWRKDELKYIFLTHAHYDHAGCLKELLDMTGAAVILCALTQKILAVGKTSETHSYKNWVGEILERAMSTNLGSYPSVTEESRFQIVGEDDYVFEDIGIKSQIIELPGHTVDSIGLHIIGSDIIFCGDAAMNHPLLNANRHTVMIENIKIYHESWDKMKSLKPDLIYPGHGKAFPAGDLSRYRQYI